VFCSRYIVCICVFLSFVLCCQWLLQVAVNKDYYYYYETGVSWQRMRQKGLLHFSVPAFSCVAISLLLLLFSLYVCRCFLVRSFAALRLSQSLQCIKAIIHSGDTDTRMSLPSLRSSYKCANKSNSLLGIHSWVVFQPEASRWTLKWSPLDRSLGPLKLDATLLAYWKTHIIL